MNIRFTAWLSEAERAGISRVAAEQGTSDNYVVRVAVRRLLGLSSPLLHVTTETPQEANK